MCNTFTPSLSLCFCRLDLLFHAVHVHLSWLNYYYPQKFGSLLIMIKDVEITIGFCKHQNKFLEELPLPRPMTEGTGSLSIAKSGLTVLLSTAPCCGIRSHRKHLGHWYRGKVTPCFSLLQSRLESFFFSPQLSITIYQLRRCQNLFIGCFHHHYPVTP